MTRQTQSIQIIAAFLISLLALSPTTGYAFAPEEIASPETIAAQAVSGDEAMTPYILTGESLVGMIQNVVGFEVPGSSILYNRRTGQLFVKNTPANHEVLSSVLDKLRESAKRQVLIEARIISVSSEDFEGLGVDNSSWKFVSSSDKDTIGVSDTPAVSGQLPSSLGGAISTLQNTTSNFSNINSIFGTSSTDYGASYPVQIYRAGLLDVEATIDALGRKTDLNTLAAPRITVFNNQRANIAIEKMQYYVSKIDSSFTGSEGKYTIAQDPDVAIARSGTILDVTPNINENGTITLELHPHFVSVDLSNSQSISKIVSGAEASVTLPKYTSQEINTTVTVMNGGVVVLGGLITEEETTQRDKVPLLGDIPVIGKYLFQNNQVRNVKTHLMMFVKATAK